MGPGTGKSRPGVHALDRAPHFCVLHLKCGPQPHPSYGMKQRPGFDRNAVAGGPFKGSEEIL